MSRFNEDQLREVFDEIDRDKSGYINRAEVLYVLKKLDLNEKEVKEYTDMFMMEDDKNLDGVITFDEFKESMFKAFLDAICFTGFDDLS